MFLKCLRLRSQLPTTSTASFCTTFQHTSRLSITKRPPHRTVYTEKPGIFSGRGFSTDDVWEAMQIRRQFAKFTVNKFSFERVAAFGPDLACLEWLMNCGASSVRMSDGTEITSQKQMRDFLGSYGLDLKNLKPLSPDLKPLTIDEINKSLHKNEFYQRRWANAPPVYIETIDATDSAVMDRGFPYLLELRQTTKLVLNFCDFFYNEAIQIMCKGRLRVTLQEIEICFNGHINEVAFAHLTNLKGLKRAHFYMNPWIRSEQRIRALLRESLPRLQVTYPEMGVIGLGKDNLDEARDAKRNQRK